MSYGPFVYVPMAVELVAQLRRRPSEPVTIQIEDLGDNKIQLVCTRHDCPPAITLTGAVE